VLLRSSLDNQLRVAATHIKVGLVVALATALGTDPTKIPKETAPASSLSLILD
jgi:hypothetical protein